MRLRCPNCRTDLDIVPAQAAIEVKCPSCGSMVDISGSQETIEYRPPKLGTLAHYELLAHVDRGHFGDVYKAMDLRLERIVAVKVPRSHDLGLLEREAFLREARTAARLRHPNIVTIHEADSSGETLYIASEFIDGINLAQRLSGRPLEPRHAAELAAKIADALQHAHEQEVIHRDLKPRNIMLDAQGEPYLLDFGLAKQSATEFTITTEGEILGTPAYMAPEQARGQAGNADARTDVYSLGVSLYEMLTGTRPFLGDTRGLIYQILHEEPAPPRKLEKGIPRDLETICLKAMSKEPARRYQSASELAADLRRFLAGEPIKARRAGVVERSWRWCRRNPAWCAATSLGTAALVLFGVIIANAAFSGPHRYRVEIDIRLSEGRFSAEADQRAKYALVVFWPLDDEGNVLTAEGIAVKGRPPLRTRVRSGHYLVVTQGDASRWHEVYRYVPSKGETPNGIFKHQTSTVRPDGTIELREISLPLPSVLADMTKLDGDASFVMGDEKLTEAPPHRRSLPPFYLDSHEVTVEDIKAQGKLKDVIDRLAMRPFDQAASLISWDEALAWAESAGKRLPSEAEYEFAATGGGVRSYPWVNGTVRSEDWPLGSGDGQSFDVTPTDPPIRGLYSNVAEWTGTWLQFYPAIRALGLNPPLEPKDYRVVRGAPPSVISGKGRGEDWQLGPRFRDMWMKAERRDQIGFRGARSLNPRLAAKDFERIIGEPATSYQPP